MMITIPAWTYYLGAFGLIALGGFLVYARLAYPQETLRLDGYFGGFGISLGLLLLLFLHRAF
jgi:hypothetical protein